MADHFDFIVVGAGPAGATIASRLAKTAAAPQVLLLEAGASSVEEVHRPSGTLYTFLGTEESLKFNYRYECAPQPQLNGRKLVYDRGRGLGGSSVINLGVWDYGRKAEMDEWARLVGDDVWTNDNMIKTMKKIENFHHHVPEKLKEYGPDPANHGTNGPVDVTLSSEWLPGVPIVLEAAKKFGMHVTSDLYRESIGVGVPASSSYQGLRVTAGTAFLTDVPANLSIKLGAAVARVLFEGNKAVGVELTDGVKYRASKEVVLSAGAIATPKILLLSGVGPEEDLAQHGIPTVRNLPGVGRNLKDHCFVPIMTRVKPGTIPNESSSDMLAWQAQWDKDKTGPFAADPVFTVLGFHHLDNLTTFPEFQQLSPETQEFLARPQTASWESSMMIIKRPEMAATSLRTSAILLNAQSSGRVSLKNSDPLTPPVIDLNYLEHPYDQRVYVGAIKRILDFVWNSGISVDKQDVGPKSNSDSDILEWLREAVTPAWHAMGTVKMGKSGDDSACVDAQFRVIGLDNLRVADMSVTPVVPSNHTQATAYFIGDVAADKLIKEHKL